MSVSYNMVKLKLHQKFDYFKKLPTSSLKARKQHVIARVMESRAVMHTMASWDDRQVGCSIKTWHTIPNPWISTHIQEYALLSPLSFRDWITAPHSRQVCL